MDWLVTWAQVMFENGLTVAFRSRGHSSRDEAVEKRRKRKKESRTTVNLSTIQTVN